MIFYVWDEINSTRESAEEVEAIDAEDAAISYAQGDIDGNIDGIYSARDGHAVDDLCDGGHPIAVEHEDGTREVFLVGVVEYEPVFGAVKREVKP